MRMWKGSDTYRRSGTWRKPFARAAAQTRRGDALSCAWRGCDAYTSAQPYTCPFSCTRHYRFWRGTGRRACTRPESVTHGKDRARHTRQEQRLCRSEPSLLFQARNFCAQSGIKSRLRQNYVAGENHYCFEWGAVTRRYRAVSYTHLTLPTILRV